MPNIVDPNSDQKLSIMKEFVLVNWIRIQNINVLGEVVVILPHEREPYS